MVDSTRTVGFLHPGKMGGSIAALVHGGIWASEGRSPTTAARAADAGLRDVTNLDALVEQADIIVSICPPDAASAVANQIAERSFDGVYVDANAISPERARSIGERFANFVDGGVIGPPATESGTTRLYLSGARAVEIASLWDGTALDARVIGEQPGAASALKMSFAAWTKGTSALLLDIHALATAEGVEDALLAEWSISLPDLARRTEGARRGATVKAWRFAGEMDEIAAAFAVHDLPAGFHLAAAEVYRRLASFKDADPAPELAEIIDVMRSSPAGKPPA